MFFFRASRYLKYLLFSRHRKGHGIHSPFIFELVSKTFRNKIDPDLVCKIEEIRKTNLSDNRIINVVDLGSGSVNMKGNNRRVSEIARFSSVPGKYGMLLSNMALGFAGTSMVELGTSLGISTLYLSLPVHGVPVYTAEGSPETAAIASANFQSAEASDIVLVNSSFNDMLDKVEADKIKPGLVFIDGDHRKERLLAYFNRIVNISDDHTAVIIDDIHHSPEMEEAWCDIRKSAGVTVTVDLNRMGIVFFKKGLSRQDYVIRY